MSRSTGVVKWYDRSQGHGYLRPGDGSEDVFVHHSAVHGSGMKPLSEGEPVEYDVIQTELGPAAEGVLRTR